MRRLVLTFATVVLLVLAGCTSGASADGGFVSGDGTITTVPVAQRVAAPEISGTTLDGRQWSSTSVQGKVLVYNVWGSWCQPCIKEAPALAKASARTAASAQFVGLNSRDIGKPQAQAFVREFGITYPNLYDPAGELVLQFAGKLPLSAIPSTVIVDTQGRVAARVLGEASEATLVGLIDDVAAGR
ncbi:MAG TPA: TlpA disulfide reductase family protein [Micropruina sp.]|jgi:thiol-disulfide isomerase/thioredoxin|nr:TlpA disulfide reductase family protein [Micropruina sp.]